MADEEFCNCSLQCGVKGIAIICIILDIITILLVVLNFPDVYSYQRNEMQGIIIVIIPLVIIDMVSSIILFVGAFQKSTWKCWIWVVIRAIFIAVDIFMNGGSVMVRFLVQASLIVMVWAFIAKVNQEKGTTAGTVEQQGPTSAHSFDED